MCEVVCSIWELMTYLNSFRLQFPFSFLLMVGAIMSLHAVLLLRASWREAHLSVGSSCSCDRRHSAAQLIVAVSVENNVASLCFTFISVVW